MLPGLDYRRGRPRRQAAPALRRPHRGARAAAGVGAAGGPRRRAAAQARRRAGGRERRRRARSRACSAPRSRAGSRSPASRCAPATSRCWCAATRRAARCARRWPRSASAASSCRRRASSQTPDAEELERLLAAILEPTREPLLKAALATELMGLDAARHRGARRRRGRPARPRAALRRLPRDLARARRRLHAARADDGTSTSPSGCSRGPMASGA